MSESIDLLILPLARIAGQEQPSVMGLYVAPPPKKAARFRKRDRLILHLFLDGNAPLPPDQVDQILVNLAKTYFNTAGTVTTALKAVAESLNQYLLDRNIRNSSTGRQAVGYLTQIALRDNRISLAQSGLSHAFLLTSASVDHIHDLSLAGNGLGLSRTTHIRFTQQEFQINDALAISIQAPPSWTLDSLQTFQGQGPESLRRKFLSRSGADLESFLVHAQSGTGELRLLRPVKRPKPIPTPLPAASLVQESEQGTPSSDDLDAPSEVVPTTDDTVVNDIPAADLEDPGSEHKISPQEIAEAVVISQAITSDDNPTQEQVAEKSSGRDLGQSFSNAFAKLYLGLVAFLKGILPDSGIFTLPPSTMAFTAIAVPITIVAVAAFVYFQRGREAQYNIHISAAQEAAQFAETKADPYEQRIAWQTTLLHLDNAEIYMSTDESQALRSQSQEIVDTLDATERLDFRPTLVDQLDETTHITRLIALDDGLYMLNSTDGVVGRAVLTDEGYLMDSTFQCGPGPYGGFIIGSLVDIAAMPPGNDTKATVVGIDANGNMLRCIPGEIPDAAPLEPPDINWGSPTKVAVDSNDLYVLDPQTNAVWIYRGMDVSQSPRLFFDQQIPSLGDVIDMAVDQNDLYLLHEDGHLTTCVYGALSTSPTRCKNPEIYTDPRPGRQSGPYIEDAFFSQIQFSPPPEPSIYMLDPQTQAIFRFSVRLTFDRQFRPQEPIADSPASAFYVNRGDHAVYLAVGIQVYYAPLP
jgi:hypothetical protein